MFIEFPNDKYNVWSREGLQKWWLLKSPVMYNGATSFFLGMLLKRLGH